MTPQLHFVTGKGGVGKTTVALCLGLAYAKQQKNVLVIEIQGGDRLSNLLGVPPVGSTTREVYKNLYLIDLNPWDVLHEYVLLKLKFEAIYKTIFAKPATQKFLKLIPSLQELLYLGKIWYHTEEQPTLKVKFDVIIVDAQATGHALGMFRAPSAIENMVPEGPMKRIATMLRACLQDPTKTVVHIVTLAEEMPLAEAIDLKQKLTNELTIRVERVILNKSIAPINSSILQTAQRFKNEQTLTEAVQLLENRQFRAHQHMQAKTFLEEHFKNPPCEIPFVFSEKLNFEDLLNIAKILEPIRQLG